jgi:hypothetical protein
LPDVLSICVGWETYLQIVFMSALAGLSDGLVQMSIYQECIEYTCIYVPVITHTHLYISHLSILSLLTIDYLLIYPPIYCLSIHLSINSSINHLYIHPSICLFIHHSIYSPICISNIYVLSLRPSMYPPSHPLSIYHLSIYLSSIYLSIIYLSI